MTSNPFDREIERLVAAAFRASDGRREGLYDLVIGATEKPLFECVLAWHGGNLSHAALTLGINRNTLRKKLLKHGIKAGAR
jgi:Fis family transcriptional regulator